MKKFFCLFLILTLMTVPCLTLADLHGRHDSAEAKAYIGRTDLTGLFTRKNEDYPFELVLPDWVRKSLTEMEIYEEIYKKVGIDLEEEVRLRRLSVKDGKYYINFKEKKIEKEVIRVLYKYGFSIKEISIIDALRIGGLNLLGFDIKDSRELHYFINIKIVELEENINIEDYSFLACFPNLKILGMENNNISDLTFLAYVNINIDTISLKNNKISDISILSKFHNLRVLYLSNNQIISLMGLENLKKLEKLYIDGNPITLDGLRYIEQLCFSEVLWKLHIDRKAFGEYGKHFALYPEYFQWVDRIYFYEDDGRVTEWRNE
ncbi:MAG: leucine-rich repeat domain-containing protein [Firmicutes bacterium]|nr:leucine-rich repeat domain-containing protein [Bacillota bacterium]